MKRILKLCMLCAGCNYPRLVAPELWEAASSWNTVCGETLFELDPSRSGSRLDWSDTACHAVEGMNTWAYTIPGGSVVVCPKLDPRYLPGVLTHELGHVLGKQHRPGGHGVLAIPQDTVVPTKEDCDALADPWGVNSGRDSG